MKIIATSRPMIRNQRVNDVPIVDDNLEVCNVLMAKFLSISLTSIDSLRGFSSVLQSRVFVYEFSGHLYFIFQVTPSLHQESEVCDVSRV